MNPIFRHLFRRRELEAPPFAMPCEERSRTTDSGLVYEVLREGTGKSCCGWHLRGAKVHHAGWTLDGRLIGSSYERGKPEYFAINGVIRGWSEALQLMSVGSILLFVVPPERAYGKRGQPPLIGPNERLVFRIELISVK
jgi:FKBP-type peptidyl-prolyl cis-trans isomerase